jgi:mannose-6-phosphate isomerase
MCNGFGQENLMEPEPYLLKNRIQNYAWGTRGKNAFIPKLLNIDPEEDKPYAELWIGTHPNAPSDVIFDHKRVPLKTIIENHPNEILGELAGRKDISSNFPFLLKILSIAEPLSIQAHPNREQAKLLHSEDPKNYPDINHKPETAIALDTLSAFIGFKSYDELVSTLAEYPEYYSLTNRREPNHPIGIRLPDDRAQTLLRDIVNSLINLSERNEQVDQILSSIEKRIKEKPQRKNDTERIFLQLKDKYPGDIGLLFLFILNLTKVQKGDAIFISPGVPHAYVEGNIVECMAPSDNVVRAGLTSKYKDLKTLANIVRYSPYDFNVPSYKIDPFESVYDTPAKEFRISVIKLGKNEIVERCPQNSLEVLLITEGTINIRWRNNLMERQLEFHQGNSILIPAFLRNYTIVPQTSSMIFRVRVPTQDNLIENHHYLM